MLTAYSIKVRGVVQGVGFRPYVFRLARENDLKGWVLNAEEGVEIHLEGEDKPLQTFLEEMKSHPPQAAEISEMCVEKGKPAGFTEFTVRKSIREHRPTV
ncbi:MAG: acylphosphatase [Candidatus Acidiferrum sp.]